LQTPQSGKIRRIFGLQSRSSKSELECLMQSYKKVSAQLSAAESVSGGPEVSEFARQRICRGGPALQTVLNNQ
jgi:hypothetical protein